MGAACHAQCMSSAGFVRSRLDLVLGPGDPSDVFQRFCANMGLASVLQALALFFSELRAVFLSLDRPAGERCGLWHRICKASSRAYCCVVAA